MLKTEDFKKDLHVVDSVKASVLMLIGLYGSSGAGKTVTAIIWAIGMVGPDATIGVVDTEQKRSTLAADVAEKLALSHYKKAIPKIKVVHVEAPYHPLKYCAAIEMLLAAGCKAIVCDSMSHSWNGDGGYLDLKEAALSRMAGDDWKKREACAMAAAAQTKPQTHAKLFNLVTHLPVPAILCFRGVEKTKIGKDQSNRTEIKRDEYTTPIHDNLLIFEMLIAGECTQKDGVGGYVSFRGPGRKHTHPEILNLLPDEKTQFGFKHGEALAAWCNSAGKPIVAPPVVQTGNQDTTAQLKELNRLKAELWAILTTKIDGITPEKANQFLWSKEILDGGNTDHVLSKLNIEQLKAVIGKVKALPPT